MAIIKCKMCGGELELIPGKSVAECEYCGSVQTVPAADSEKKLTLFARANRLRAACEFDKAAGIYENIVSEFPEEAEAYWGLVLCKYGIEYVDDPATGKKIPTCHRSSFESVMEDSNFEQTMENADALSLKVYREEAKRFEEIRKGIIEVSSKEDPYDIFICYKETDSKGDRTVDSLIAQNIYDALTEKGYRVFFSRITLEDKLGVAYEPYIFAALNSAKVMLAVGTAYEYYNAVWVKNEWSRFLKLMAKNPGKHLIPCYKDIDAYDIPKEFAHLQAQDMGKVGAMADLVRGVEKLLEAPQPKAAAAGMQSEDVNRLYMYNSALEGMKKRDIREVKEAVQKLESLGNWNDAPQRLLEAKKYLKKAKRRRRTKWIVIMSIPFLIAAALLIAYTIIQYDNYKYNYSKGEMFLEQGDYDEAADYFGRAHNYLDFGDAKKREAEAEDLAAQVEEKLAPLNAMFPESGTLAYFTREDFEYMIESQSYKEFELMLNTYSYGIDAQYCDLDVESWWYGTVNYDLEQDTYLLSLPELGETVAFTLGTDGTLNCSDGRQFVPIGILAEEAYNEALSMYNRGDYEACCEYMEYRFVLMEFCAKYNLDLYDRWCALLELAYGAAW